MNVEEIHDLPTFDGSQGLLAIIIRRQPVPVGTHFVTSPDQPQQVAFIRRPAGSAIEPHIHHRVKRTINQTQEVLIVQRGKVRISFFTSGREYVGERLLSAGDTAILVSGGHGMEFDAECELIEVKQGPYCGAEDKVYFREMPSGAISAV